MKPAPNRLKAMIPVLLLLLSPFRRKGGGKKTAPGLMSRTDPWSVWGRNKYPMVAKRILVVLTIVSLTVTGPYAMADLAVNASVVNNNTVLSVRGTINTTYFGKGFDTYGVSQTNFVTDQSHIQGGKWDSGPINFFQHLPTTTLKELEQSTVTECYFEHLCRWVFLYGRYVSFSPGLPR